MIRLRSVRSSVQSAYNQTTCGVSEMTDRQLENTLEIQKEKDFHCISRGDTGC